MPNPPPGLHSVANTQRQIREAAPSWLEARYHESPIIAALPRVSEIPWNSVFNWESSDCEAEQILAASCGIDRRLGISQECFVESTYLFDAPEIDSWGLEKGAQHGWSQEFINSINKNLKKGDDTRHRMRGAAGWMICQPAFLEERNQLLEVWNQMTEKNRSELPLYRTPQFQQQPEGTRKVRPPKRVDFQQKFDVFCDRWRLLGMITWDLPKIDGPKWTDAYPGRPESREGMTCHDTPFHFPLLSQDGLGELAGEEHSRLAETYGFTDQSKWQTYAQLLRLNFWENVIDQRYASYDRVKAYATNKLDVLAALLDLNVERTRKLRTQCNKLRSGRRPDLSDFR